VYPAVCPLLAALRFALHYRGNAKVPRAFAQSPKARHARQHRWGAKAV